MICKPFRPAAKNIVIAGPRQLVIFDNLRHQPPSRRLPKTQQICLADKEIIAPCKTLSFQGSKNFRFVYGSHRSVSRLTTKAQRRRPRGATLAAAICCQHPLSGALNCCSVSVRCSTWSGFKCGSISYYSLPCCNRRDLESGAGAKSYRR